MDRDRFDALARILGQTGSRRAALAALLGVGVGSANLEALGQRKRKRSKNKPERKNQQRVGAERQKKRRRDRAGVGAQADATRCCSRNTCAPGRGKNLYKCCYHDQDLSGETFQSANLGQANFSGASLVGANLQSANLDQACLVDADITGARLRGANTGTAIFCRTQTDDGEDNSGCGRGTPCCPTCDADNPCADDQVCCGGRCIAGECCDNGEQSTCGDGGLCCDHRCVTGDCCETADCPTETCQTKSCRDSRCAYEPVTGQPGPRCQTFCCQDEAGDPVCCETGITRCDGDGQCCTPACDGKECGEDGCGGECPPGCPQGQSCDDRGQCVIVCGQEICDPDTEVCCGGGACVSGVCCQIGDACLDQAECCDTSANDTACVGDVCCVRAGRVCQPGQCCSDLECCGADAAAACVDTNTDDDHCGGCGNPCPDNASCAAGQCECDAGFKPCGTLCIPREACCTGEERGCVEPTPNCCVDQGNGVCRDCCDDANCTDPASPVCTADFVCVPCDPASAPCNPGEVCCGGGCFAGECCSAAQCDDEICQDKRCTDAHICAYENSADGQPGRLCADSICCSGECCLQQGAVCDANQRCCQPDTFDQTCAVGSETPKCGPVTDNCGRTVECGACAIVTCFDGSCTGPNDTCEYRRVDNNTQGPNCDTDGAFCCGGDCCTSDQFCDVREQPAVCCTPTKRTCEVGVDCGDVPNGCGETIPCGGCPAATCQTAACSGVTCDYDPVFGEPGPGCQTVCCMNAEGAPDCCAAAEAVCDAASGACCVPQTLAETCGVGSANTKCGVVTDNCGQSVTCPDCAARTCETATCNASTDECVYTPVSGAAGPGCQSFCCQDTQGAPVCCDAGVTICQENGTCGCVTGTDCETGQACCAGQCESGVWANQTTFGGFGSGRSQFVAPNGVAVSEDGATVWVADSSNDRVSVWAQDGGVWTNVTAFGSSGPGPDRFNSPTGVAVAADGQTVLVADRFNNRVSVWARQGDGSWSPQTTFGSLGSGQNQLAAPFGVAVATDGGTAWVADSSNHRVSVWAMQGDGSWSNITTFGSRGSGPGQFNEPFGVAVSEDELTVWVADRLNSRVSVWAKQGDGTWSPDTTFGSAGSGPDQFSGPFGVAISEDERTVWVADRFNSRVAVWTEANEVWSNVATFGSEGSGPNQFSLLARVAVAGDDRTVWVADTGNHRISVWGLVCPA